MDLHSLASGLLACWLFLGPSSAVRPPQTLASETTPFATPSSGRFTLTGSATIEGRTTTVRGRGAFAQPADSSLDLELEPGRIELVVKDGRGFYRLSPVDRPARLAEWQQFDPQSDLPHGAPSGPEDLPPEVESALAALLDQQALVGTETTAAGPALHYRLALDLGQLLSDFDSEGILRGLLDGVTFQFDYWIGLENRYLTQFNLIFDAAARPHLPSRLEAVHAELAMVFSDFDQPISIEAPPLGRQLPPTPTPTPRPAPVQAPVQIPRGQR